MPLLQSSNLSQPRAPRGGILAVSTILPDEAKDGRIKRDKADVVRQALAADDLRFRGRGDLREARSDHDLDLVEEVFAVVRGRPGLDERSPRLGRDDNVDVVEGGREHVEVEREARVIEDNVHVVVPDVAFLADQELGVGVCGHDGGDVEDDLGDAVAPAVGELAVVIVLPI